MRVSAATFYCSIITTSALTMGNVPGSRVTPKLRYQRRRSIQHRWPQDPSGRASRSTLRLLPPPRCMPAWFPVAASRAAQARSGGTLLVRIAPPSPRCRRADSRRCYRNENSCSSKSTGGENGLRHVCVCPRALSIFSVPSVHTRITNISAAHEGPQVPQMSGGFVGTARLQGGL